MLGVNAATETAGAEQATKIFSRLFLETVKWVGVVGMIYLHGHQSSSFIAKYNDNKIIGGTSYYALGEFDSCKLRSVLFTGHL